MNYFTDVILENLERDLNSIWLVCKEAEKPPMMLIIPTHANDCYKTCCVVYVFQILDRLHV